MRLAFGICALLLSPLALGQSPVPIDAELFNPSTGQGFYGVAGAEQLPNLAFRFGAFLNFANDPLVVFNTSEDQVLLSPVKTQSALDLTFAIGYKKLGEFGLALPLALVQSGDDLSLLGGSGAISGGKLGDLRLTYKRRIIGDASQPFALSALGQLKLPTGSGENFFGSEAFPFLLGVAGEVHLSKVLVGATLAFSSRPPATLGDITISQELRFGLGASYEVNAKLFAMAEIEGAASLNADSAGHAPTEARLGAKLNVAKDLWVPLGLGVGLNSGIGAPDFRLLAGVLYAPPSPDPDGDGIKRSADSCPLVAEDKDSFEDTDGCPEDDNDKDGLVDKRDQCPDKAEDTDSFEDADGCPEDDNDKDGLLDAADQCPTSAEDKDQFADEDGCPEDDNDKDDIADKDDKCINEPEDKDKFEDTDGCPESDNDKDGFADASDQCPNEKETFGTPFDRRGEDGDGCPDEDAVVALGKIKIKDRVFFDLGKATLQKRSNATLDAVAKVMIEHPEISKIRIEGHTDDIADEAINQTLSEERAKMVLEYLVKKGVERERMEAAGYGKSRPLVPADGLTGKELEEAREQNRRVEFSIVQ